MGGSMMKKESLILLLSVYTCLLFAVPADMTPQYVVMANGDSILVVLHGAMSYAPTMTEVLRTKKSDGRLCGIAQRTADKRLRYW